MKKIILIGDSIRMGYAPTVEAQMSGMAEIWHPKENGGTSANVLAHLDEWVINQSPDLVHINAGLHDLARHKPELTPRIGIDEYKENLGKIFDAVRQRTHAILIWARTTPVNEAWHNANKGFHRMEADVENYNRVADSVCKSRDVPINDLYAVVTQRGRDTLLVEDGVHYKPEGSELLGKHVAQVIREALA